MTHISLTTDETCSARQAPSLPAALKDDHRKRKTLEAQTMERPSISRSTMQSPPNYCVNPSTVSYNRQYLSMTIPVTANMVTGKAKFGFSFSIISDRPLILKP